MRLLQQQFFAGPRYDSWILSSLMAMSRREFQQQRRRITEEYKKRLAELTAEWRRSRKKAHPRGFSVTEAVAKVLEYLPLTFSHLEVRWALNHYYRRESANITRGVLAVTLYRMARAHQGFKV